MAQMPFPGPGRPVSARILALFAALLLNAAGLAPAQASLRMSAPLDDALSVLDDSATGGGAALLPAPPAAIVAEPLRPDERLVLDGRLEHPAWQRAPAHNAFVERAPVTGGQPRHATEVRVLYDDQALYVGVRSEDPEPERIRAPLVRYDGVNRTQDFVVVYIDGIGQRQSAQFFRVNAAGSTADGMHTAADDSEDFAPDFDWDAAVQRDARGWSAVLRLPFASLRYAGGPTQGPWRIMVARRVPREQFYLHSSVLIPRDAPSFIATLQPLQGLRPPTEAAFLSLRPSLTWRRSVQRPAGGPDTRQTGLDLALDLKWRPLPELVVDAALNPDFSQVALDVPQLQGNTRYALEYEEKRPFFFEASDLLRSPTVALYTRSITEPRWGLRATWRGAGLAGTAIATEDRGGGLVLLPGAYGTGVADQPASQALVARLRGDAGPLQWGALASARRYDGGLGHNQVGGADLAWQIDEAWRLRAQWLQSDTTALLDAGSLAAPLPRLRQGPAERGQQRYAKLSYQAPTREWDLWLDDASRGFRNDQGFAARAGAREVGTRLGHGWHGLGVFNDFWVNLEGHEVRAHGQGPAGDDTVAREVYPWLWFTGPHNLDANIGWHGFSRQRLDAGQPLLRERYWKGELTFTPAPWVPLLTVGGQWGRLADVHVGRVRPGGKLDLSLSLRPLAPLELEPRLSLLWLREAGQLRYREQAHQLIARWHFDARHSLRAIVQYTAHRRVAEPGVAGADDQGTVGSLTYAWRPSSGTVFYLGASHQRQRDAGVSRGNELFAKLQVDVDEARRAWQRR